MSAPPLSPKAKAIERLVKRLVTCELAISWSGGDEFPQEARQIAEVAKRKASKELKAILLTVE